MNTMQSIESRLVKMDYEIHTIMREIRASDKSITLSELVNEIGSNLKDDSDTTGIIKEMKEKG